MSTLNAIRQPITKELQEFEQRFALSMKSVIPLLDRITHYIIRRKGKQVRPMMVFLSAKIFGPVTSETYAAASLVELLHTATLVHDDVVDAADMRRGFFSINAIWKNKIAVLVGDYLFSKGLLIALEDGHFETLRIFSRAVREISEGELLQIDKSRKLDINEEVYYQIIRQKTASMLAACCASGAASVDLGKDYTEHMRSLGYAAGTAYQIKDDLLDYGYANIGKPTGNDIKEKKMTLPLIYSLSKAPRDQKKHILRLIKRHSTRSSTRHEVLQFVREYHGLEYAAERMDEYTAQAMGLLNELPQNQNQVALKELINYMITRAK